LDKIRTATNRPHSGGQNWKWLLGVVVIALLTLGEGNSQVGGTGEGTGNVGFNPCITGATTTAGTTTTTAGTTTEGTATAGTTTTTAGTTTTTAGTTTTTAGTSTTTAGTTTTTAGTTSEGTTTTAGTTTTGTTTAGTGQLIIRNFSNQAGGVALVIVCADENVSNVTGLNLSVQYPTALTISNSDVNTGGSMFGNSTPTIDTSMPGVVNLGFSGTSSVSGPGLVARLSFHIPSDAALGTVYPITLVSGTTTGGAGSGNLNVTSGTITVSRFQSGDASGNGSIGVEDATLALRAAVGQLALNPDQQAAADITGDGDVTIADAVLILRLAVGLDIVPPVESTTGGTTTAGTTTTGESSAGTTTTGTSTAGTATSGTATSGETSTGATSTGTATSGTATSGSTTAGTNTAGTTSA